MEKQYFRLISLLPSLCALFISNGFVLNDQLRNPSGAFQRSIVNWDPLASGLVWLALEGLAAGYAWLLLQPRIRACPSYYIMLAALIADLVFFHRPLLIYIAALTAAGYVYKENDGFYRVPIIVGLLVVPLFAIIRFDQPERFVALAVGCVLLAFSLYYGATHNSVELARFFTFANISHYDFSLDCLFLLTVGGFAWVQACELLGPIVGTVLYLPIAIATPPILGSFMTRPIVALRPTVLPRPVIKTLADLVQLRGFATPAAQLTSQLPWDGLYSHLSSSTYTEIDDDGENIQEAEHLLIGLEASGADGNYQTAPKPILLDRSILAEHLHILGRSGSNKTSLGIIPIVTQLIRGYRTSSNKRSPDRPVVIIDLKGDPALFHTVREEAEANGQDFLFFNAEEDKPSFFFNPFSAFQNNVSIPQATQSLLDALNLNHGEGYGRSYFTRVSRQRLLMTLKEKGIPTSFQDLYQKLNETTDPKKKTTDDAFELHAAIEAFLLYPQLFTTQEQEQLYPETIINFDRVLDKRQVVYFWLPAQTQSMAAREIGKLALFNLFAAAKRRQDEHNRTRQSYLIIDEFQRLVGENLTIILEQARSYGIGAILSNHSAAQLRTADGKDLWPLINGNTAATIHFGSKDITELEMLSRLSGEYLQTRSTVSHSSGTGRSISFNNDSYTESHSESISQSQHYRPKFMVADLQRIFSRKRRFILSVQRNSGFTKFDGAPVVVDGIYSMPKETYLHRQTLPWPTVPTLPKGIAASPKTEFSQARPSQEMLEKIRILTQER
jgi:hypothetical protein